MKVLKNADGTATLVSGRYRETIDPREKSQEEIADAVKWAAITAGHPLPPWVVADIARTL